MPTIMVPENGDGDLFLMQSIGELSLGASKLDSVGLPSDSPVP